MERETAKKQSECLLFLSWQSDRKDSRNFVSSIVDALPKKISSFATISVDRDTMNVPGAPDIGDTIFEKIDICDLFLADITLINDKDSGYRRTPNPNVLIELGYAIKTLGWERIILLQCEDYGDVEELPFDINHRRICNFSLGNDLDDEERTEKRRKSKQQVLDNIASTIAILQDKNLLFGGKKVRVPKFEVKLLGYSEILSDLRFRIKNVSSLMISAIQSHSLTVYFNDDGVRELECNPYYSQQSLSPGEEASIRLRNPFLGYGPGYTNYAWCNIDLIWQFSCEDEEGTVFWYELAVHVDDAEKPLTKGVYPIRYIG